MLAIVFRVMVRLFTYDHPTYRIGQCFCVGITSAVVINAILARGTLSALPGLVLWLTVLLVIHLQQPLAKLIGDSLSSVTKSKVNKHWQAIRTKYKQ